MLLFETERLLVRQLSRDDLPALTVILSDPAVMKFSVRGVCDEAATAEFIDWCLGCYTSHGFGPWALIEKSSGEFVGFCGVGPEQIAGIEEVNLGYRLAQRFWNQGFATEAVIGTLDHAFSRLGCHSVVVIIEPEHKASVRVCEKAGFVHFENTEFHGRSVRLYRLSDKNRYLAQP